MNTTSRLALFRILPTSFLFQETGRKIVPEVGFQTSNTHDNVAAFYDNLVLRPAAARRAGEKGRAR